MKLTTTLLGLVFLLILIQNVTAQDLPRSLFFSTDSTTVKYSEIKQNHKNLSLYGDSTTARELKFADRWFRNNAYKMSPESDTNAFVDHYTKALKSLAISEFFCLENDLADWSLVGPKNILPQNQQYTVGQVNGQVSAIHYDPDNPNDIVIGTTYGGIFRTTNYGENWVCVTDDLDIPILGVNQIAQDPIDSNRLIAVIGGQSGLDPVQDGYLISEDFGETWTFYNGPSLVEDQFVWFAFDPNIQGRVYAAMRKRVMASNDGGESWFGLQGGFGPTAMPEDFYEVSSSGAKIQHLRRIEFSDDRIFIINESNRYAGIWKGDLTYSGTTGISVSWSTNFGINLMVLDDYLNISPGVLPGNINIAIDYDFISNEIYDYNDVLSNRGCDYDVNALYNYPFFDKNNPTDPNNNDSLSGMWNRIRTDGWSREVVDSVNFPDERFTCELSNTHTKIVGNDTLGVEVVSVTIPAGAAYMYNDANRSVIIKAEIPNGVRFRVSASPYAYGAIITQFEHSTNWICNLPDFDYDSLFTNVIYESGMNTSGITQSVDLFDNFDFLPEYKGILLQNGGQGIVVFHMYLEYDTTLYDPNEKFILTEFGLGHKDPIPNLVSISNIIDGKFILHVRSEDYSALYLTEDNGDTFSQIDQSAPDLSASETNEEIILSENVDSTFYRASVYDPQRLKYDSNGSITQTASCNGNGRHDDHRVSLYFNENGTDHILWGNDGGISETITDSTDSAVIYQNTLNGDLAASLIYNMDLNPHTGEIGIALQDNGTQHFFENVDDMTFLDDGDGSVIKLRTQKPNYYVSGDPQLESANALHDYPENDTNGIVNDSPPIAKGEAFLGMRLEPFRFDDDKFICGLKSATSSGGVLINRGKNQTERVYIPGAEKIMGVGLCQRDTNYMYASEGQFLGFGGGTKLYRSNDAGHNWSPVISVYTKDNATYQNFQDMMEWKFVNALGVDHVDTNLIYLGISGVVMDFNENPPIPIEEELRILRSTDGGDTLIDWSQGLPAMPVKYILPIESSNHLVFAAIDGGVYYRTDNMDAWECYSSGLPKCDLRHLVYNYCTKELYVATFGRGVWKTPVDIYTGTDVNLDITSTTTWNNPQTLTENIVVKSGNTLFVNDNVYMEADRKIIVEPGARLVVQDSAIITSNCDQFWDGIEVWGDQSALQQAQYQGTVTLTGGASIQNAKNAIRVWNPGDWTSMGGIVQATNASFVNNKRDVEFMPYSGINVGSTQGNVSYFKECEFKTDTSYLGTTVAPHVSMFKVDGVRFTACDFSDERNVSITNRGKGIHALDAKFKVLGKFIGTPPVQVDSFDVANYSPTTFSNLTHGVWAGNATTQNAVMIDQSLFTNCQYGVVLSQSDNAVVSRNKFNRTEKSEWFGYQHGIYSTRSSGYLIEGNIITKEAGDPVIGIINENSGVEDNEVYKNWIRDVEHGVYGNGRNKNDSTGIDLRGLEYLCNSFVANTVQDEIYAAINSGDGVKIQQGVASKPAGNEFTDTTGGVVDFNVNSSLSTNTDYFYYNNSSGDIENPNAVTSTVIKQGSPFQNECESNFDKIYPRFGSILNGITVSSLSTEHEGYLDDLDASLDNLSRASTQDEIDSLKQDIIFIQRELNRVSNIILKEALFDSTVVDSSQFVDWVLERNDVYRFQKLVDFYWAQNDSAKVVQYLDSVKTIGGTYPSGEYLNVEFTDYEDFKTTLYGYVDSYGNLRGLDSLTEVAARDAATQKRGHAQVQGQNLLCFFLGECDDAPELPESGKRIMADEPFEEEVFEMSESDRLAIFPNPSSSEITVSLDTEYLPVVIRIIDAEGKQVLKQESMNKEQFVDISGLKSGVYFVLVTDQQGLSYMKKLVKNQ